MPFVRRDARGALPCAGETANRAYLEYVRLAHNLSIYLKLHTAPRQGGVNCWTVDTLRRRVWNVVGNLRRHRGGWRLSLPVWWPYRSVYRQIERRCRHWSLAPPWRPAPPNPFWKDPSRGTYAPT